MIGDKCPLCGGPDRKKCRCEAACFTCGHEHDIYGECPTCGHDRSKGIEPWENKSKAS